MAASGRPNNKQGSTNNTAPGPASAGPTTTIPIYDPFNSLIVGADSHVDLFGDAPLTLSTPITITAGNAAPTPVATPVAIATAAAITNDGKQQPKTPKLTGASDPGAGNPATGSGEPSLQGGGARHRLSGRRAGAGGRNRPAPARARQTGREHP